MLMGRRSLSVDLKEFDPEINHILKALRAQREITNTCEQIQSFYSGLDERNRQMVDSSCGGAFLHKTEDEAWDLFENLSDNSQQHVTSSRVGKSRQIGNRTLEAVVGMQQSEQKIPATATEQKNLDNSRNSQQQLKQAAVEKSAAEKFQQAEAAEFQLQLKEKSYDFFQ
ncbi:hypothetical protein M9H77_01753 [Catharanthus roseus]|uniref:Uncharacterized protein n=1 Tax=Catharanthus roseus TaxID=4058 RepID=A0ACC0C6I4_CATRO|nr:hypothetical protein M9H77_01753 [Catharanthus roseus]